jgi:hypothetical protein
MKGDHLIMMDNNENYIIYKFYNDNQELLYVGITNNIKIRLKQHKKDKEWFGEINKIYISTKLTRNESHIYEIYYIANVKPKYNIDYINGGRINFMLDELIFTEYKIRKQRNKLNINIVLRMYNSGKSIKDISKELEYADTYIYQQLRLKLIESNIIKKGHINYKNKRYEIFVNCLKCLSSKTFFIIDDIVNKFSNEYKCSKKTAIKYYKEEFKSLIDNELKKLGLIKITANKEIKEKYNIDVSMRSYPKIIVKND